ncbi:MAG: hypothetical protein RML95_13670 [Anaerolineae bacterium]|nr:hypothetical protein [Anaerolineae bacterium]MDW8300374.1 hypothetical protein [Anaerolineae bacterium]
MIRRVILTVILALFALAGIGLGSLISAETQPPAAVLVYSDSDRQERVPPDGTSLTLGDAARLHLAHAQLDLSNGTRLALRRHHASPINGWQVAVALFEGQANGRLQPRGIAYRFSLLAVGGSVEMTGEGAFVAYGLPNGDLLFGVTEGSARVQPNNAEALMLQARQGVQLTADGRAAQTEWAVLRAAAYRLDGTPLALPLHLTDSQGITFRFTTGQVVSVPSETYRVVAQTAIPYIVEGLRLSAEQPVTLAFTFGEVVFRLSTQNVTASLSNQIVLRVAESENAWQIVLDEPVIAAPGTWTFFVRRGNTPEQRIEAVVLTGRQTEVSVR